MPEEEFPGHDRRGFARAFVRTVRERAHGSSLPARIGVVAMIVVLIAAGSVGAGMLFGHHPKPAAAAAAITPTASPSTTRAPAARPGLPDSGRRVPAGGNPAAGGDPAGGYGLPAGGDGAGGAPASRPAVIGGVRPGSATRPGTAAAPRPAAPAPTAPRLTYSGVTGYGCPASSTRGFHQVGRYVDGIAGWYTVSGGWRQNGCDGRFAAVPMSGSATQDDNGIRVLWWFVVGAASRHCGVSVYVPASSNARDVAGSPAYYYVLRDTANAWYARFAIDQVHNRGRWVPAGTYRVYNGQIVVKLVNRGVDWVGSTNTYAHLAAAQVRVTCTSA